jgi:hypothetical protein
MITVFTTNVYGFIARSREARANRERSLSIGKAYGSFDKTRRSFVIHHRLDKFHVLENDMPIVKLLIQVLCREFYRCEDLL